VRTFLSQNIPSLLDVRNYYVWFHHTLYDILG